MTKELTAKKSKSSAIFPAVGWTLLVLFFIYKEKGNLFDWKHFNPHGYYTIFSLIFLFISIFSWVNYFDHKAVLKLNNEGIWKRKNWVTTDLQVLISWSNIDYFFVLRQTVKGVFSEQLIIKQKDSDKKIKIGLTGLDVPGDLIITSVREQSERYSFHDLGIENNNNYKA